MAPLAFAPAAAAATRSPFVAARPRVTGRPTAAPLVTPRRSHLARLPRMAADDDNMAAEVTTRADEAIAAVDRATDQAGDEAGDYGAATVEQAKANVGATGNALSDAVADAEASLRGAASQVADRLDVEVPSAKDVAAASKEVAGGVADAVGRGVEAVKEDVRGTAADMKEQQHAAAARQQTADVQAAARGKAVELEKDASSTDSMTGEAVGKAGGNAADSVEAAADASGSAEAKINAQATREAQDRVDGNPVVQDIQAAAAAAADGIREFSDKSMEAAQAVGDAAAETAYKATGADIKQNYGENHPDHP
ncbi:hypothetical protein MMPV_004274 [Pyropia vietnamensis]